MRAAAQLRGLRGFIVDLDGTTYVGDRLIPGAHEFFDTLHRTERRHVFVTNNSSKSGDLFENALRRLGLDVADGQVLTSGEATAMFLAKRGDRRVYVVGTPALEMEMARAASSWARTTPTASCSATTAP
jgi:HAD superfamily hydrolase (TIGR01450 family)